MLEIQFRRFSHVLIFVFIADFNNTTKMCHLALFKRKRIKYAKP